MPRSVLIARPASDPESETLSKRALQKMNQEAMGEETKEIREDEDLSAIHKGYMVKTAEFFVATLFDIVFLGLPVLCPETSSTKGMKTVFQPLDDLIEGQIDSSSQWKYLYNLTSFKELLARRIHAVSDTLEAGDEIMYRFSSKKLAKELLSKAQKMVTKGLPASLEERFVRQPLISPVVAVKREESSISNVETSKDDDGTKTPESPTIAQATDSVAESNSTVSSETSTTTASTAASTPPTESSSFSTTISDALPNSSETSPEVVQLLKIRTCLDYMLFTYVPQHIATSVQEFLSSPDSPVDFKPLDEHLKHLAKLKAEVAASRSLGDFSRKRTIEEDDDMAETRAEKKRKKEEEEKRKKAGESRGVRDLKKVDVKGMKKMSDFFTKAAPKKK